MTDAQKRMAKKLGLDEESFEPKATQGERTTTLEETVDDIILMLADYIGGED